MPAVSRPNKKPHHRLKELRRICGFTQQELASKIGTSLATIVAVETGSLQMSENLATRIMVVTGVEPRSLLEGPKLLNLEEGPFDKAAYDLIASMNVTAKPVENLSSFKGGLIDIADTELKKLSSELEGELRAMVLFTGKRNQFYVFRYLFREWSRHIARTFDFEATAKQLVREHPGQLVFDPPKKPARRERIGGGCK